MKHKRIIISQPWGGLGDNLSYSTLPELFTTDYSTFTPSIIAKNVYVIVGVTFLTYLLTMYGLKYLSPAISSSYIYIQPVLVVFFAFFLASIGMADDYTHTITFSKIMYMLLICTGVYTISKKS